MTAADGQSRQVTPGSKTKEALVTSEPSSFARAIATCGALEFVQNTSWASIANPAGSIAVVMNL
jgi:hypothetical protein